jgi:ABC-type uncharacterized transport system auxiliary subunit
MRRLAQIGAAAAMLAALGGCAVARKAEEPAVLRVAPVFAPGSALAATPSISVAPVQAGGVAAQRRYAYVDRSAPREVKQAATLFWDEPPARVLERALVDGLRTRFAVVAGADTATVAEQRLVVRLDRFEEQTAGGQGAEASVAFDATALGVRDRKISLSGRYCARAPVTGEQPSDRARAFEAAVADAVLRLAADLRSGQARSGGC